MNTPYETYNNQVGVKLSFLVKAEQDEAKRIYEPHESSLQLISYKAYKARSARHHGIKLRAGLGKGNEVLIAWSYICNREPEWKDLLISKFGDPIVEHNPLEEHFILDGKARVHFNTHHPEFEPQQVTQYTIDASTWQAFERLKIARETMIKGKGNSSRGKLWPSLIKDLRAFKSHLKKEYGFEHKLPLSERRLRPYFKGFSDFSYEYFTDMRGRTSNAAKVTPLMLEIWRDIYAGQKGVKPDYTKVHSIYEAFLAGVVDVLVNDTGEAYDRTNPDFVRVDRTTVYNHQTDWQNRVYTHYKRSGNRQRYLGDYVPHAKMKQPEYAGSIISVDDRQPPFKYANGAGNRMWFYLAQDLGSEAFTTWVYGDTKEGIIDQFYKQMVRNYADWGVALPDAIECESALNSSFRDSFLSPGAMFNNVRIIANDARSKRIERTFEELRYRIEANETGFIPRVTNKSEHNQERPDKIPFIPKEDIVRMELRIIWEWNNSLHSNQELHPGMTRWDVFIDKQHPKLSPTNWRGFMPFLGECEESSMKLGRIRLQGKSRVVGSNGEVYLGDKLLNVMAQIEGKEVQVRWIRGNNGDVLKALVYNRNVFVCELLDDLPYHRAQIEQTDKCRENMALTSAYRKTVEAFISRKSKEINSITIIENQPKKLGSRFVMPELEMYTPSDEPANELPTVEDCELQNNINDFNKVFNTSTASRF